MSRVARNKLEFDLLPPFGKPEVSLLGDVALFSGLAITFVYIIKNLE